MILSWPLRPVGLFGSVKTSKILLETFHSIKLYGRQFLKVYNKEQVVEEPKVPGWSVNDKTIYFM